LAKRELVTGGYRKLHDEELHNFSSSNIIRLIKSRSTHGREEELIQNVVKKSEKLPMHRRKDNIKIYLNEIGWKCVECIHLVQEREHLWAVVDIVSKL
jgi:hypothetical protein